MKPIEKFVEQLPIPIIAALAVTMVVAWLFKEYFLYPNWGRSFRDPVFQVTLLVVWDFVVVYYIATYILAQLAPFSSTEKGILVARFHGDEDQIVQGHTLESIKTRLNANASLKEIKVRRFDGIVTDESVRSIAIEKNAVGVIAGLQIQGTTVHYLSYWRDVDRIARMEVNTFPDIGNFLNQFISSARVVPAVADVNSSKIDDLSAEVIKLREQVARLHDKNQPPLVKNESVDAFKAAKKKALIVGVSQYKNPDLNLRYATNDAQAMARLFKTTGAEVHLLTNPSRADLIKAMQDIKSQLTKGDYFYFYFSGHGAGDLGEHSDYLMPSDTAATEDYRISGVSLTQFVTDVGQANVGQAVYFVDAFMNQPLRNFPREVRQVGAMFAGEPGQSVWEDARLGGGIFTYYLIRGMSGDAADAEGVVEFKRLYRYTQRRMLETSGRDTRPSSFESASQPLVLTVSK